MSLSGPPDSWIESSHDPTVAGDDAGQCSECGGSIDAGRCICNPCDIGTCGHATHCDKCGVGMIGLTETGLCEQCVSQKQYEDAEAAYQGKILDACETEEERIVVDKYFAG